MIDFIPYGKQTIKKDDIKAVVKTLKSAFLTTGPKVLEFEKQISNYCGSNYCVALSSGTAALHLASLVLLNKNDKVLTTVNSFVATSNSILYVNAKPIFVDICEDGNINLDLCEDKLKQDKSIKAIYVVHFSGKVVNQDKLKYLKDTYNIKILEDCSHSLGANFNGIKAGSCINSDCSIFSFHPVKHITTAEGGAITTNQKDIYEKLLFLRSHGIKREINIAPWYYEMHSLGFNYRISDILCALGISQLKKLDSFIKKRRKIAKRYDKAFWGTIIKPIYTFTENSSYHLYVVRVDFTKLKISKIELFNKIKKRYIGLQLHYIPINKQPFYKNLGFGTEETLVMDKYYQECFSLPIYPLLSSKEQKYVIKNLLELLN